MADDVIRRSQLSAPYYFGVDAMRFLAALMVAVFHFSWKTSGASGIAPFGWVGVQIFFLISGFVIANSATNASPIQFVKARLLRLYPAAWVCALLALGFLLVGGHSNYSTWVKFAKSFFLLDVRGPWLGTAYWTLPVELSFYAGIFLLLSQGLFARIEMVAVWLALASFVYLCALSAYWAGFLSFYAIEFGYGPKNMSLLRHGVYFALGIFLWLHSRERLTQAGRMAAIVSITGAVMEIGCRSAELAGKFAQPIPFLNLYGYTMLVWLVSSALIVLSVRFGSAFLGVDPRLLKTLRVLGLATYPFYLLHEVIGLPAIAMLQRKGLSYSYVVLAGLSIVFMVSLFVSASAEPRLRRQFSRVLNHIDERYLSARPIFRSLYRTGGSM